jgi:hypothetical protein
VNYAGKASNTLIFGGGSTGKTTFAYRLLLNLPGVAVRFIFDEDGQAAARLRLPRAGTARQCEDALLSRWVCFNPYVMFRAEQLGQAFRWFCHWAFQASQRGPGIKLLFVDEQWKFCDARNLPAELERVVRTGRFHDLQYVSATHRPRDYHVNVRALVTEWVCFNTIEPAELDAVRPYFPGVDRVATLPRGQFIAYNRESGAELSGRVF